MTSNCSPPRTPNQQHEGGNSTHWCAVAPLLQYTAKRMAKLCQIHKSCVPGAVTQNGPWCAGYSNEETASEKIPGQVLYNRLNVPFFFFLLLGNIKAVFTTNQRRPCVALEL